MPRPRLAHEEEPEEFHFKEPGEDPEYDAWFHEQVQIGIDEADRGELIPHEEMVKWFAEQKAELLKKIEKQKHK